MITEIATLDVKADQNSNFEDMVKAAIKLFSKSPGWHGIKLYRSVEAPSRYRLFLTWETVESHTVAFRTSKEGEEWRSLIVPFLSKPADIEHLKEIEL